MLKYVIVRQNFGSDCSMMHCGTKQEVAILFVASIYRRNFRIKPMYMSTDRKKK